MKERKKGKPDQDTNRPVKKKDDSDKRHPNPEDPYEEEGMPNKEMPASSNPHHEEIADFIPKIVRAGVSQ